MWTSYLLPILGFVWYIMHTWVVVYTWMAFSSLRKKSPSVSLVTTIFLLSMFLIHLFAWPYTRFNVSRKKNCCFSHRHEFEPVLLLVITCDGDAIYSVLSAFQKVGCTSLYQMLLQNIFCTMLTYSFIRWAKVVIKMKWTWHFTILFFLYILLLVDCPIERLFSIHIH